MTTIILNDNENLSKETREILKLALANDWLISFEPNYEVSNETVMTIDSKKAD